MPVHSYKKDVNCRPFKGKAGPRFNNNRGVPRMFRVSSENRNATAVEKQQLKSKQPGSTELILLHPFLDSPVC